MLWNSFKVDALLGLSFYLFLFFFLVRSSFVVDTTSFHCDDVIFFCHSLTKLSHYRDYTITLTFPSFLCLAWLSSALLCLLSCWVSCRFVCCASDCHIDNWCERSEKSKFESVQGNPFKWMSLVLNKYVII